MKGPKDPRGNLLSLHPRLDGLTRVVVDNGPVKTIQILTRTEDTAALLDVGLDSVWEHLMTRKPGHFRKKGTTGGASPSSGTT